MKETQMTRIFFLYLHQNSDCEYNRTKIESGIIFLLLQMMRQNTESGTMNTNKHA